MAEAIMSFKIINPPPSFSTTRFRLESKSLRPFSGSIFINGFHLHSVGEDSKRSRLNAMAVLEGQRDVIIHKSICNLNLQTINNICWGIRIWRNDRCLIVRASTPEESETEEDKYEEYEVEIEQPYGLKFAKGRDGGTYIDAIAPGGSADKTKMFTVGDKVIATSAVFGTEIWPAAEYGRTMYTIRQRIGPLLMKMQKRYGKTEETGELTEKEIIRAERNSGVVSSKVREIQMQNYLRKKEQKETRERELREGLKLYKSGKYEEALEKFESVLGSKPEYNEASVASYNVACCYSKLNQIQAGLSALEDAMKSGYEDFKRIRTDPDLENIRKSEEFEPLMKKFDESFINENALNAIKSLFGFNKS